MDEMAVARHLSAWLHAWTPRPDDNVELELVQPVVIDERVGLELRWLQTDGTDVRGHFALFVGVAELLARGQGLPDRVAGAEGNLRLAMCEPHQVTHPGVPEVFTSLP